jgi:hypothetical protein
MTVLTPEQEAREKIDDLLESAGWSVQSRGQANLSASLCRFLTSFPDSRTGQTLCRSTKAGTLIDLIGILEETGELGFYLAAALKLGCPTRRDPWILRPRSHRAAS